MLKEGRLFWPAKDAYPHLPFAVVTCDRCGNHHLAACFHHGVADLCLPCADAVVRDTMVDSLLVSEFADWVGQPLGVLLAKKNMPVIRVRAVRHEDGSVEAALPPVEAGAVCVGVTVDDAGVVVAVNGKG